MKVLIIIPTKEKVETNCLEAAYAQDYADFSVMVNRRKPTEGKTKFQNIVENRIELQEKALKTDADYFLWLDSDVVLPKDAISLFMKDPKAVMGGWCHLGGSWSIGAMKDGKFSHLTEFSKTEIPVDHVGFGAMMVSRAVMEAVKVRYSFDEKIGNDTKCECFAFCEEAKKAGFEVVARPILCGHKRKFSVSVPQERMEEIKKLLIQSGHPSDKIQSIIFELTQCPLIID